MAIVIGVVLSASALLLVMLPGLHRRFARKAVVRVDRFLPLFGMASIILGGTLLWFVGLGQSLARSG